MTSEDLQITQHAEHQIDNLASEKAQALAEACAAALWADDKATQSLDIHVGAIKPGACTLSMTITDNMCNGHGTCHGGYIFTLADSAFAFACNTYNQRCVAQHCTITYLNPAQTGDQLDAHACELSRQGRGGIYDIRVINQLGTAIAEFRGHSRTIKGQLLPED